MYLAPREAAAREPVRRDRLRVSRVAAHQWAHLGSGVGRRSPGERDQLVDDAPSRVLEDGLELGVAPEALGADAGEPGAAVGLDGAKPSVDGVGEHRVAFGLV